MRAMYELDGSLKKIASGTAIGLLGVTFGLFLSFVARLVVARYGLQANYGIFSMALAILNLAALLATLGLNQGAVRYIAYFRSRNDMAKVRATVSNSIKLSSIASLVFCLVLFFAADVISQGIFHTTDLILPLRIFAVGIPFFTLILILLNILRGFDQVAPMVIFQHITLNVLFLALLSGIGVFGLPFTTVFYAYLTAVIGTFIALLIYFTTRLRQQTSLKEAENAPPIIRELLLFSLPLLGVVMSNMIITWTDTLMLGYFKTPQVVGLYNAAYPLAQFISEPLVAMRLIYTPVAAGLYARHLMTDIRRSYTVSTKWLVFLTLPIFLMALLYPEAVLNIVFGSSYAPAALALRILALGFIFSNFLGPNGAALMAVGHSRFLMFTSLTAAVLNVVLNIVLIPPLGIAGAAIATVASISLINVARTIRLYSLYKIQPFTMNLLKPAIICVVLAIAVQFIARHFLNINWWLLILVFVVFYGLYGIAALLSKSFDIEDIAVLLEIEKRSGINATPIKKLLRRFL